MKKPIRKTKQFSIRWPTEIVNWVDGQRRETHRTRAAEFIHQMLCLIEKK